MDLRIALTLVGLLILAAIAFHAFARRNMSDAGEEDLDGQAILSEPEPYTNPNAASLVKRSLTANPAAAESFAQESAEDLREIERAANLSLEQQWVLDGQAAVTSAPDQQIDFIIKLPGRGPLRRDRPLGIYNQNEYKLEKPRAIYGLRQVSNVWSNLEQDPRETEYSDLLLSVQLADREGPVNEAELNTFVQLSLKLADHLHRPTKLSMFFERALERAKALDHFCHEYDVIASVHVLAQNNKRFYGPKIRELAERYQMQLGDMGLFHRKNVNGSGGKYLFSLANIFKPGYFNETELGQFKTGGLTFFMSVPMTDGAPYVFDEMLRVAMGFSQELSGRLLDQERRPLSDQGITVIRTQISRISLQMEHFGIAAGSPAAMRLFN